MAGLLLMGIVLLFLVIFGSILYMITHYFVHRWKDEKIKKRTITLWIWRLTILVVILYIFIVLFLNRNELFAAIAASQFVLFTGILIFFISLIEVVVIDILLPDIIPMWKRVLIELLLFITLVIITIIIFSTYTIFYSL